MARLCSSAVSLALLNLKEFSWKSASSYLRTEGLCEGFSAAWKSSSN